MKYRENFTLITFLIIFLTYNFIGYSLNIDALKAIVFDSNKGVTISFIALFIPVIISYIVYYATNKLKEKY